MAKQTQSTSFDPGLVEAGSDRALSALSEVGARAEALVEAWISAKNVGAILETSEHGTGAVRKAARRGLNILRSRGVPIPVVQRVASLAAGAAPEVYEAWMMAPDSSGMELFAISARPPAGRHRITFVFLHGSQGVARIENANMSQSQLDEYFGQLLPGAGYKAVKVPTEWARHRIADARRVHRERGLAEPLGFTTAASLLEPVPAEAPPHPFDEEGFELADEDALELSKKSGTLHTLPEFRSWLPSNEAMQEFLVKVGEQLTPGSEANPDVIMPLLKAEVEAATDRFFTPELRQELVRRMKDAALSVFPREGEHRALEIASVIKTIERAGLVTNPPREIEFLKAFFDKAVALMIAQGGGRLRIPVPNPKMAAPEAASAESAAVTPA